MKKPFKWCIEVFDMFGISKSNESLTELDTKYDSYSHRIINNLNGKCFYLPHWFVCGKRINENAVIDSFDDCNVYLFIDNYGIDKYPWLEVIHYICKGRWYDYKK